MKRKKKEKKRMIKQTRIYRSGRQSSAYFISNHLMPNVRTELH